MSSQDQTQIFTKPKERADLSAGPANVPVWMFTLLTVLLFCGGLYLERFSGGFNAMVYEPFHSFAELERMQPAGDDSSKLGRAVYSASCSACHQPSGLGAPGMFPPLAGSEWVTAEGPDRLIRIVLHGLSGPIEVSGKSYNNVMVPWKDTLNDTQIAAVLTYIRQEWGNEAAPVAVEQVKAVREATADRASNWTAAELETIPLSE